MTVAAWCVVLVASLVGVAWKDARPHAVSLAIALIMLVLTLTHAAVLR